MPIFLGPPEGGIEQAAAEADAEFVYALIEEYYKPAGVVPSIRHRRVLKILLDVRENFPFGCTLAEASPFKKAAAFTCDFVLKEPVITAFPATAVTDEIIEIPNHQNAIIALQLSCLMLHGAELNHSVKGMCPIKHAIEMSTHFRTDLIDYIADPHSAQNPRGLSLIYESLVYQTNDLAYKD